MGAFSVMDNQLKRVCMTSGLRDRFFKLLEDTLFKLRKPHIHFAHT